jgi:hypothetical protein
LLFRHHPENLSLSTIFELSVLPPPIPLWLNGSHTIMLTGVFWALRFCQSGIIQRPCKTNVCEPNVQRRESWVPKIPSEKPIKLQVLKGRPEKRELRVGRVYLVWPIFRTIFISPVVRNIAEKHSEFLPHHRKTQKINKSFLYSYRNLFQEGPRQTRWNHSVPSLWIRWLQRLLHAQVKARRHAGVKSTLLPAMVAAGNTKRGSITVPLTS